MVPVSPSSIALDAKRKPWFSWFYFAVQKQVIKLLLGETTITKQIENIQNQEAALDKGTELVRNLETLIAEWQRFQPDFNELMAYYGSAQWHEDVKASNEGALEDVKCGVLSEDAVHDLYGDQRALNLKMMRVALDYLEG